MSKTNSCEIIMNGCGDQVKGSIRNQLPDKLFSESKYENCGWTGFNWIYLIKIKVNLKRIRDDNIGGGIIGKIGNFLINNLMGGVQNVVAQQLQKNISKNLTDGIDKGQGPFNFFFGGAASVTYVQVHY